MIQSWETNQRSLQGKCNHFAGLMAEDCVARLYNSLGGQELARRWRGRAGEIDLVFKQGEQFVFVEVKKARDFEQAAQQLTPRQSQRIYQTGSEYLAGCPLGQNSDVRFDLALVNDFGDVEVIANAILL